MSLLSSQCFIQSPPPLSISKVLKLVVSFANSEQRRFSNCTRRDSEIPAVKFSSALIAHSNPQAPPRRF